MAAGNPIWIYLSLIALKPAKLNDNHNAARLGGTLLVVVYGLDGNATISEGDLEAFIVVT